MNRKILTISKLHISLFYFFLCRQKQKNKHVVPMPWSALEGIYVRGMCVCLCLCVFLLILLFPIEQNNQDLLAPGAACAQSNGSEVQWNECGYRPNNKMVNCALTLWISCSTNQCLLQFWHHKMFLDSIIRGRNILIMTELFLSVI